MHGSLLLMMNDPAGKPILNSFSLDQKGIEQPVRTLFFYLQGQTTDLSKMHHAYSLLKTHSMRLVIPTGEGCALLEPYQIQHDHRCSIYFHQTAGEKIHRMLLIQRYMHLKVAPPWYQSQNQAISRDKVQPFFHDTPAPILQDRYLRQTDYQHLEWKLDHWLVPFQRHLVNLMPDRY